MIGSKHRNLAELARELERELFVRAATAAHRRRDVLVDELRQPGTVAVVCDLDEWGVSLVAALLTDEFRRRPAARGEMVRVCRVETRRGETGILRHGLVVDRA